MTQAHDDALFRHLAALLAKHAAGARERSIAPRARDESRLASIARFDFAQAIEPLALLDEVVAAMTEGQMHATHPRYFGLFHPAPIAPAIAADALVAAFDPQLATRGHAPYAIAIEDRVVRAFGERFGYASEEIEGTFTSGGAEANATALLVALHEAFPEVQARGVRALKGEPRVYVSAAGHPTVTRAAQSAGLGSEAVCVVSADERQRMKPQALSSAIARDRRAGKLPFFVVATAGTTSAGAIDPLADVARVSERARCWLHVDAAWGGLAALVPELASAIEGCARADSITFDAHKVLPVPMGAGMYLSRRRGALSRTFRVARAGYTPRDVGASPHGSSMQWSRRFIGLKVFVALASLGWEGLAAMLRGQIALGHELRTRLRARGWRIENDTPLPVVCFVDETRPDGASARFLEGVARAVLRNEGGWISMTRLSSGAPVLRACVNHHGTDARDLEALIDALEHARRSHSS